MLIWLVEMLNEKVPKYYNINGFFIFYILLQVLHRVDSLFYGHNFSNI